MQTHHTSDTCSGLRYSREHPVGPRPSGNVPCQVMAPLSVLQSSVHPYLVYAVHRGVESKLVIQGNTDCINLICGPVLSTEQNGPEMSDVSANN